MKPTVPEVLPIVQALYRRHSAGCCWHIVLDDGNVGNDSVAWCVNYIETESTCRQPECRQLCDLLPKMSRTQRIKLGSMTTKTCTTHGLDGGDGGADR